MLHISPEITLGPVNKQATEHCNDEKQMTDHDERQVLDWCELSRWHSDFLMIFFPLPAMMDVSALQSLL